MAQTKVIIRDHTGAKKTPVELPDDVPMRRLVPALVTKMGLPTTQGGQPLTYALDNIRTGKRLRDEDTLRAAGVQSDDVLTLLPQVTAGLPAGSPRLRRLQSDYDRLKTLVAQSNLIRIAGTERYPPERYVIEFTCRGVERVNGNQPVYSEHHRAGIALPGGYPTAPPAIKWLTPIFHPNISSGGSVCIGPWYASKWLDELVFMLAEMIQYKIPPTRDTLDDVYNTRAVEWLRRNPHLLPVDSREIRGYGDDLLGQIKIGGEARDDDLFGRIKIGG